MVRNRARTAMGRLHPRCWTQFFSPRLPLGLQWLKSSEVDAVSKHIAFPLAKAAKWPRARWAGGAPPPPPNPAPLGGRRPPPPVPARPAAWVSVAPPVLSDGGLFATGP